MFSKFKAISKVDSNNEKAFKPYKEIKLTNQYNSGNKARGPSRGFEVSHA